MAGSSNYRSDQSYLQRTQELASGQQKPAILAAADTAPRLFQPYAGGWPSVRALSKAARL